MSILATIGQLVTRHVSAVPRKLTKSHPLAHSQKPWLHVLAQASTALNPHSGEICASSRNVVDLSVSVPYQISERTPVMYKTTDWSDRRLFVLR